MRREPKPTEKWSLEKLGKYCQSKTDRMAVDAWLAGRAMALAKRKSNHGEFTTWKRKWRYSDATVSRYIRLYETHKSAESLRGKEIMEALREGGIVAQKPQPPNPQMGCTAKAVAKKTTKAPSSVPAKYAWAMDAPFDLDERNDVEDVELEVEATSETVVRLEIEKLPSTFSMLKRQLDWIATQETKLLLRAWPREHNASIKAGAKEVQQALQKLLKLIPR